MTTGVFARKLAVARNFEKKTKTRAVIETRRRKGLSEGLS
jgi:hypothetical protein